MISKETGKTPNPIKDITVQSIPLFSTLSDAEAASIQSGLECRRFHRGESIFKTGARADRLYIVHSGRMKIYKYLPDGGEQILYIYSPGDFVGGFNLIKAHAYLYNARALESTVICTLVKEKFDEVVLHNPQILLKIVEKAFERVRWAEELVERLNASSADQKVAGLLLDLMADFAVPAEQAVVLKLSINREEMGNYTGLSRETVTRKLKQLQERGLIALHGNKRIDLLKIEVLREMAGRI